MRSVKPKRRKAPTVAKLKKKAWKLLSELVRRSNHSYGLVNCYTCGVRIHWKDSQAGHAIPGRTGSTLLDEEIIRPQCFACNIPNHGRYEIFTTKLIREKAIDVVRECGNPLRGPAQALAWWEGKLSASRKVVKWDRTSLQAKIEEYRERLARL